MQREWRKRSQKADSLQEQKKRTENALAMFKVKYKELEQKIHYKEDGRKDKLYSELLEYLNELKKWTIEYETSQHDKTKRMLNVFFEGEVDKMNFHNCFRTIECMETPQDMSSAMRHVYAISFYFACREYLYEQYKGFDRIPFVVDNAFACFNNYELEKVLKYFSNKKEQIIFLDNNKVLRSNMSDYFDSIYEITTNEERSVSQIRQLK